MKFDLKRNWPVIGAAALGLGAIVALQANASGGSTSMVSVPPSSSTPSSSGATGGMDPGTEALLTQALQYEASIAGVTASEYDTYIGAGASNFAQITQGQIAESQAYAYATAANAARPTFMQQLTGFVNSLSNAYATYQTGGLYRAPSSSGAPSSYGTPTAGWPSTGWGSSPAPSSSTLPPAPPNTSGWV